ncbi:Bug family tripartite tricarboxylate transporter substrate binding protein [Verticiella sediminum]|nr:tripartite tricarboxylate transporter substrate binding protein [Verticiella sediminum]
MTHTRNRARRALLACATAALAAAPWLARAADAAAGFPSQPIRIIVPYPAGGGTDMLARMVGNQLQKAWGQTVVVENMAGALGQLGMNAVARAKPDGYTIVLGISSFLQAPYLYKNIPYDIYKDFEPITVLARSSNLWTVPENSPIKTFDDMLEQGKSGKGLNYGSYGAGTSAHLHMEQLMRETGMKGTHVPYKGAAPLVNDALGGHLDVGVVDVTTSAVHVKAGTLRVLAVDGTRRVTTAPDAPTLEELGHKGLGAHGWFGFLAPAGTPEPIVQKLSAELNRIIRSPEMSEAFASLSLQPGGTTPQETRDIMASEGKSWGEMIKSVGVTLE